MIHEPIVEMFGCSAIAHGGFPVSLGCLERQELSLNNTETPEILCDDAKEVTAEIEAHY